MKPFRFSLAICMFCTIVPIFSITIPPRDASLIGNKIWKNECGGKKEHLICWNKGENFPSLGIGHFIWYPTGQSGPFEETFPSLLTFLKEKNITIPTWLIKNSGCPWQSRDEFYENIQSDSMKTLRQFLWDTKDLQAIFIANRLEKSFMDILKACNQEDHKAINAAFLHLSQAPEGLYALIDYLNFKGSGISLKERYKGEGWGLLQVLKQLPPNPSVSDFVSSAKASLIKRVDNSPPEREEKRWLPGWINRLNTYLEPL